MFFICFSFFIFFYFFLIFSFFLLFLIFFFFKFSFSRSKMFQIFNVLYVSLSFGSVAMIMSLDVNVKIFHVVCRNGHLFGRKCAAQYLSTFFQENSTQSMIFGHYGDEEIFPMNFFLPVFWLVNTWWHTKAQAEVIGIGLNCFCERRKVVELMSGERDERCCCQLRCSPVSWLTFFGQDDFPVGSFSQSTLTPHVGHLMKR